MKSKRWLPFLLSVLMLAFALSACNSTTAEPEDEPAPTEETTTSDDSATEAEPEADSAETEAEAEPDDEPAAEEADAGEPVEIRYALWDSNQQPAYQACADAFTTQHPDITISIEQAGWNEYWDGLTSSLVSGTAPDVFTNHLSRYPELLARGQLLDIQPYVDRDGVDTSIYLINPELWAKDGARYGLPKDWDTIALYYNQDMFDAAGITAEDIASWTWNPNDGGTFEEAIAMLTLDAEGRNALDPDFDASNVVQWGFSGGAGDASSGAQPDWSGFAASTGFQLTDGPWTTAYHYDDERVIDTVQWWADLHLENSYAPGQDELGSGVESLFFAGRTAMFPMGSWNIGWVSSDATFPVGFAPLPEGPEGRRSPINGLSDAIYSGTEHPDEAWAWVSFLASTDCANIVGDHGVVFPAIQSGVDRALASYEERGLDVSAFTDIASTEGGTYLLPMTEHGTEIRDLLQPVLQDIFDGRVTAEEALPQANSDINALFQ